MPLSTAINLFVIILSTGIILIIGVSRFHLRTSAWTRSVERTLQLIGTIVLLCVVNLAAITAAILLANYLAPAKILRGDVNVPLFIAFSTTEGLFFFFWKDTSGKS